MRRHLAAAARPNSRVSARPIRSASSAYATFAGQVLASADDAYEVLATGVVNITDTTLQIGGYTGVAEPYATAVRFTNVTLAQGDSVPYAQLRFVSRNQNTKGCLLRVWCEAADNAAAFTTTTASISGRTKTTAYIDWDVPAWEVGQDNAATLNENLAALVQEVVNRAGWVSGNAIVFLIETSPAITDTEFPRRRAWSYDGSTADAARLSINTTTGQDEPEPSPAGTFSDGYDLFGLEGNASFNPASPTLKDGTAITGAGLTYYNALMYWALNASSDNDALVNIEASLGAADLYHSARQGQNCHDPMVAAFRLTGDLRLLDRLCDGYAAMRASAFRITWDLYDAAAFDARSNQSLCGYPSTPNPWSPYNKIIRGTAGGTYWATGTDVDYMNTVKLWGNIAEFAWILHLNRAKTSPTVKDYDTLADLWGAEMEDFVDAMSGAGSECWRTNYNGDHFTTGTPRRPAFGEYPVLAVDGSHTACNGPHLSYYLGRLAGTSLWNIPNASVALADADAQVTAINSNLVACSDFTYGTGLIAPRSASYTGTSTIAQYSTYTGYSAMSYTKWWMIGRWRSILTADRMNQLSRAYADMHNTDGSTLNSLAGNGVKCGMDGSTGYTRTAYQNTQRAFAGMNVFAATGETKLDTAGTNAQDSAGGGYATPKLGLIPGAQFTAWALRAVADWVL